MTDEQRRLLIARGLRALAWVAPEVAAEQALRLFSTVRRIARPEWERELVARGTSLRLSNGLAATSWGEGPCILLVHGWQGRGSQLALLAEPLVKAGFRVVALDGPAHGDSPGERTNAIFFARALAGVAEEVGPLHGIVGHSFGGGATVLALAMFGVRCERAVLVASPASLSRVVDFYLDFLRLPARAEAAFRRRLEAWVDVKVADLDLALLGERLRQPALIAHDPADREVRFASAEAIVARWPGSRLLRLEGAGHRRILKDPRFLQAVTEFFAGSTESRIAEREEVR